MAKRTPEQIFRDIEFPEYKNRLRVAVKAAFKRNAEDFGFETIQEAIESYEENDERYVANLIRHWRARRNMDVRHHLERVKDGLEPLPTDTSFADTLADFDVNMVPIRVTARQAREALIRQSQVDGDDKIQTIQDYIAAIVDPYEKALADNYWERSQDFERSNMLLNAIATNALGYTQVQIDDLFRYAQTL